MERFESGTPKQQRGRLIRLFLLLGPGLMVMLADTDAGSVITAAQSGAQYGYRLVLLQVVLIPVLYLVQEVTARLGLVTGQGHGVLIRQYFGAKWALLAAGTLFLTCFGALITEFAGVAGVGSLVGLPRALSISAVVLALVVLVVTGGYRRVEHVGIAVGLLELMFIPAAILARPDGGALLHGLTHPISSTSGYLTLVAANVGTTVIPWMIYYQQGAVVQQDRRDVGLRQALRSARADTIIGAVLCQVVTAAIVIATAATIGVTGAGASLDTVGQIAVGLAPVLGQRTATLLFGLGMTGAALVATLVASLAGGWGMSEVLGWRHNLNDTPRRAVGFYGLVVAGAVIAALVVLFSPDLVGLSVGVGVMNACLLPIVLGFLLLLERRALPPELRMRGLHRLSTLGLAGVVMAFGLFTAITTVVGLV